MSISNNFLKVVSIRLAAKLVIMCATQTGTLIFDSQNYEELGD